MVLHSPSRTSSVSCPFVRCDPRIVPSSRTTSREVRRPFNAPNPESPLPGSRPRPGPLGSCLRSRASSRASKPASVRLRRFSRPWRLSPLRALWCVSTTHVLGVVVPLRSTRMNSCGGWMSRDIGLPAELPVRSVRPGPPWCRHRAAPAPSLPFRRPAAPSVRRGPKTPPSRRSGSGSPLARGCCRCPYDPAARVSSLQARHPSGAVPHGRPCSPAAPPPRPPLDGRVGHDFRLGATAVCRHPPKGISARRAGRCRLRGLVSNCQ